MWYYWTYDAGGNRFRFSTGCTKKVDAFDFCMDLRKDGRLINRDIPKKVKTVTDYGKGFWDYDTCPLIQGKIRRGGKFGKETALQNQRMWEIHVEPFFHNRNPETIATGEVDRWLLNLPEEHKVSFKTANNCLVVFRQMLEQMKKDGYLQTNPADGVKPLIAEHRRRGAFSPEQIKALFSEPWKNRHAYLACYLAARTGMRLGEIRALTKEQVFITHIVVNASWSDKEGRKSTKSGYERLVPITEDLYKRLMEVAPPAGGLIFTLNGEKPVNDHFITHPLRERMDEINKRSERVLFDYSNKQNPLSFHSFRHFLNSRLVASDMPAIKIRAIIGHESDQMTYHYAHLGVEDLRAFRLIQEGIA